jgi:hypothetical protein
MDVQINEIQSQVHAVDSQTLLEPRLLQQIVRACIRAINDEQAREKRLSDERRLTPGVTSEEH